MVRFPEDLPIWNLRYFNNLYKEGECGTVFCMNPISGFIGVRFDDYSKVRHDLGGDCDDGHGYWVYENFLVLEEPDLDYGPVDLSKILEVD